MKQTLAEIIKPYDAVRTPCPTKGTKGKYLNYDKDRKLHRVEFKLPFTCTDGHTWEKTEDNNTMVLLFKDDEINIIEPKPDPDEEIFDVAVTLTLRKVLKVKAPFGQPYKAEEIVNEKYEDIEWDLKKDMYDREVEVW